MKAIYYSFAIILAFFTLSACTHPFNFQNACWQQSSPANGQCGHCIKHHCEKYCENCKGYGDNCKACWSCIKDDNCMEN